MKTLTNFRDLGGMALKDGRKVKEKRILRSGEISGICEEDRRQLLESYNLKKIVDFR